jgi:hypothetical protein
MPAAKLPKAKKTSKEVEFDFIKSNFFRVIHADGAIGGLTTTGLIHMALYNERRAIPTKVVHRIEDGAIGAEILARRESRRAVVREVEIDVIFGIEQAVALHNWLGDKITRWQKHAEEAAKAAAESEAGQRPKRRGRRDGKNTS